MKLVAVMVVRDGQDLVQHCIDHHVRQGVSAFYVCVHASRDNTLDMVCKHPAVAHVECDDRPGHHQGERATKLARLVAVETAADWIVHVDVDEFWVGFAALAEVPAGVGVLRCVTIHNHLMLPDSPQRPFQWGDLPDYVPEPPRPHWPRALHRPDPGVQVDDGGHNVQLARPGPLTLATDGPIVIHHFPIRDYAAFVPKVITALIAVEARPELPWGHSCHWRHWGEIQRRGKLPEAYAAHLAANAQRLAEAQRAGKAQRWPS
jgi:hypothetical protein